MSHTMQTDDTPTFIPAKVLTPALIERIITEYDGATAAEVIRAINGTPEHDVTEEPKPHDIAGFAMWLALGAAAVAWILTHS
jgi:hypothetical protein